MGFRVWGGSGRKRGGRSYLFEIILKPSPNLAPKLNLEIRYEQGTDLHLSFIIIILLFPFYFHALKILALVLFINIIFFL